MTIGEYKRLGAGHTFCRAVGDCVFGIGLSVREAKGMV